MKQGLVSLIVLLLLLAFGLGRTGFTGLLIWLLILGSASSVLLQRKAASHFTGVPFGLITGPVMASCIVGGPLAFLQGNPGSGLSNLGFALLLFLLMMAAFLYVRRRILGKSKPEAKELQTNERRPLLPPNLMGEDEAGDHERN
jgi:hypothetical protein